MKIKITLFGVTGELRSETVDIGEGDDQSDLLDDAVSSFADDVIWHCGYTLTVTETSS